MDVIEVNYSARMKRTSAVFGTVAAEPLAPGAPPTPLVSVMIPGDQPAPMADIMAALAEALAAVEEE